MKYRLGCTKKVVAALALAAFASALLADSKPEKIYRKVLPAVMTLEVENNQGDRFVGSGVLALGDDLVLTAWHVVWDARTVWATFANGERVKVVGCIDKDGERDLAVLKLERKLPHIKAAVCRDLQAVGSRVYVIGAPKGYAFSISDGLLSQIRRVDGASQYQVSCPISTGNSGGPVMNERGEVIGIISWTKSDAQNVSFAIPARELASLNLERSCLAWEKFASTNRASLARRAVDPTRPISVRQDSGEATLADFKKALEAAAGKSVTVIIRENEHDSKFKFVVPQDGLR
jgi:S1-C subfamily serine protease